MKVAWLLPVAGLSAMACGGGAAPTPPSPPEIRTDLAMLRKLIEVPPGVVETRFTYAPLGTQGGLALGPTDYQVNAWMRVDPNTWSSIDAQWGAPTSSPHPKSVPSDHVTWLSPSGPWPSLEPDGAHWIEPAPLRYTNVQLGKGAIRAHEAVRVGTSGLFVTGMTQ